MNDELRKKLLLVLPHLRFAEEEAKAEAGADGKALFGILVTKPDGTGKVVATFEAPEFVEDLAKLLDAPPLTEEDRADARAAKFLQRLGL
jgi:hypothetical protein